MKNQIKLSDFEYDKTLDISSVLSDTISNTSFILGSSIHAFEEEFAQYTGSESCVTTANCTDSLRMCLQSVGVGPGSNVIVPSFTWLSTAEVVKELYANPIYVDIDDSLCVDTTHLQLLVRQYNVDALIYVNLFGNVCDIDQIKSICNKSKRNISIIEDNAQATGATYKDKPLGATNVLSCYSFYPTKNLSTWGDAGCVTGPEELVAPIRSLRNHGQGSEKFISRAVGWNSRMDTIHADILRVKLPHLDTWNTRRKQIAEYYMDSIRIEHKLQLINPDCDPVYHQYSLLLDTPMQLQKHLTKCNIQSRTYYSTPIHRLNAYENGQRLPLTEFLGVRNLSIPVHQYLTDAQVEYIVESVNSCGLQ